MVDPRSGEGIQIWSAPSIILRVLPYFQNGCDIRVIRSWIGRVSPRTVHIQGGSEEMLPGEKKYPHIFSPGKLGKMETKNRIKYASTETNFNYGDGFVSDKEVAYMEAQARGGAGMVTTQGAYTDPRGEGQVILAHHRHPERRTHLHPIHRRASHRQDDASTSHACRVPVQPSRRVNSGLSTA